jgi:hypothetical protein
VLTLELGSRLKFGWLRVGMHGITNKRSCMIVSRHWTFRPAYQTPGFNTWSRGSAYESVGSAYESVNGI